MHNSVPITCSLDQAERPRRQQLMEELGRELVAVDAGGRRANLTFEAERLRIDEFIDAESGCCPFFDFAVSETSGRTVLHLEAPEDGEWAARGLVAGFVAGWGGLL